MCFRIYTELKKQILDPSQGNLLSYFREDIF